VHDLLHFKYPSDQPWTKLVRPRLISAIRRASQIIAISRTTADDLLAIFPEVAHKVHVIYNGYDPDEAARLDEVQPSDNPYAIILGSNRPRKNVALAVEAVAKARVQAPRLRLVVTGNVHPQFRRILDESRDFVHCVGVMPRKELFSLIAGATALLYPSRYEGFGLPLLEAMSVRCPIIALDTPINREIGNDAVCYLPESSGAWKTELLRLSYDRDRREELCERGIANLKRFSWDKAADEYAGVFKRYI
jgi:alpha-1,3-rhamnosyl/mannosyltransferase